MSDYTVIGDLFISSRKDVVVDMSEIIAIGPGTSLRGCSGSFSVALKSADDPPTFYEAYSSRDELIESLIEYRKSKENE
jgi:hypothetical protein